jgi:hypothetical protein
LVTGTLGPPTLNNAVDILQILWWIFYMILKVDIIYNPYNVKTQTAGPLSPMKNETFLTILASY